MTNIIQDELNHLAKLARVQLSPEDKVKLRTQIDDILTFVQQLQDCDTTDIDISAKRNRTPLVEWVESCDMTDKFLRNIRHPIRDHAVEITGKLKQMEKK